MAAKVTNALTQGKKTVRFTGTPDVREWEAGLTGTVSQASWDNRDMMPALRALFHCRTNEIIVAISIDDHGIAAKIETILL